MAFVPFNFGPKKKRGIPVRNALTFPVGWRKTIVGWVNLRLIDCADKTVINLSPEQFAALVPEASADAVSGVVYLTANRVEELGFRIAREEVIA
jgi:hypothetical protein